MKEGNEILLVYAPIDPPIVVSDGETLHLEMKLTQKDGEGSLEVTDAIITPSKEEPYGRDTK